MEKSKTFNASLKHQFNDKTMCPGFSIDEISNVLSVISPERHAELDAKLAWLRGKTRSV